MIRLLIGVMCLAFGEAVAQKISVFGEVSIHNSEYKTGKRQYVDNAAVEDNLRKAQPAMTREGRFELVYIGFNSGSEVNFTVRKAPLEVVNFTEQRAALGQNFIVKISMTTPEMLLDYREELYLEKRTSSRRELEKKNQSLQSLLDIERKRNVKNQALIDQLESQLAEIKESFSRIDDDATKFATTYALVNLDDMDEAYKRSFELYKASKSDEALLAIRPKQLLQDARIIRQEQKLIEEERRKLKVRDSIQMDKTQAMIKNLSLTADIYWGKLDLDSATYFYQQCLILDPTDVNSAFDYAQMFLFKRDLTTALKTHLEAWKIAQTKVKSGGFVKPEKIRDIRYELAKVYHELGDRKKMEAVCLGLLDSLKRGFYIDEFVMEDIANFSNALAASAIAEDDKQAAEELYQTSLDALMRSTDPDTSMIALQKVFVYKSLAGIFVDMNDTIRAAHSLKNAMALARKYKDESWGDTTIEIELTLMDAHLRSLRRDRRSIDKYEQVAKAYKDMCTNEAATRYYAQYIIEVLGHLANEYETWRDYKKAEATLEEALKLATSENLSNPDKSRLANVERNLGSLLGVMAEFERGKVYLKSAANRYKELLLVDRSRYIMEYARSLSFIATIFNRMNELDSAVRVGAQVHKMMDSLAVDANTLTTYLLRWTTISASHTRRREMTTLRYIHLNNPQRLPKQCKRILLLWTLKLSRPVV